MSWKIYVEISILYRCLSRYGEIYQVDELREKFLWVGDFQVIVELPRFYPGSIICANDLIDLSLPVGFMLSFEGAIPVTPKAWKNSVPKKIHHPRILKKLSKKEMKRLPEKGNKTKKNPTGYQGDIVDAIGIWQWGKDNLSQWV